MNDGDFLEPCANFFGKRSTKIYQFVKESQPWNIEPRKNPSKNNTNYGPSKKKIQEIFVCYACGKHGHKGKNCQHIKVQEGNNEWNI